MLTFLLQLERHHTLCAAGWTAVEIWWRSEKGVGELLRTLLWRKLDLSRRPPFPEMHSLTVLGAVMSRLTWSTTVGFIFVEFDSIMPGVTETMLAKPMPVESRSSVPTQLNVYRNHADAETMPALSQICPDELRAVASTFSTRQSNPTEASLINVDQFTSSSSAFSLFSMNIYNADLKFESMVCIDESNSLISSNSPAQDFFATIQCNPDSIELKSGEVLTRSTRFIRVDPFRVAEGFALRASGRRVELPSTHRRSIRPNRENSFDKCQGTPVYDHKKPTRSLRFFVLSASSLCLVMLASQPKRADIGFLGSFHSVFFPFSAGLQSRLLTLCPKKGLTWRRSHPSNQHNLVQPDSDSPPLPKPCPRLVLLLFGDQVEFKSYNGLAVVTIDWIRADFPQTEDMPRLLSNYCYCSLRVRSFGSRASFGSIRNGVQFPIVVDAETMPV
ncbi:hypothetical protein R3P38DRAFT_2770722 [Favolaschia claudopus]|uniref:Uncharacterized protein n=1 Tax=Favolaschia claudopus TaxID=2862362 RepID=A0AAW0CI68_9AGAR